MGSSVAHFKRLPRGSTGHPADCLCRLHESGVWAGYDPVTRALVMPNSPVGEQTRERLQRRFRITFQEEIGPGEWQRGCELHREADQKQREERWKAGNSTAYERSMVKWQRGVAMGHWPGEPATGPSS
ncbi:hypothetical protein [Miltoncostaea oceani]|uniref:hypothetical protein n=1 Tax=Miltoncostaea oceani TaxID=2843216 RepID=UPI001C3D0995|nr:hypothetical protein [Miltoncostaea oceani]